MKDGYVGGKERNKTCGRKVSTSFSLRGQLWHFKKPLRLPESKASWTRKALKQLFSKICQFPHLFIPQAIPKPFKLREHFLKKEAFRCTPSSFLIPTPNMAAIFFYDLNNVYVDEERTGTPLKEGQEAKCKTGEDHVLCTDDPNFLQHLAGGQYPGPSTPAWRLCTCYAALPVKCDQTVLYRGPRWIGDVFWS